MKVGKRRNNYPEPKSVRFKNQIIPVLKDP
jgi:hypothetical protein